jgi:hypothetical protein
MGLVVQSGLQASDYRSKCRRPEHYRPGGIRTTPPIGGLRTAMAPGVSAAKHILAHRVFAAPVLR